MCGIKDAELIMNDSETNEIFELPSPHSITSAQSGRDSLAQPDRSLPANRADDDGPPRTYLKLSDERRAWLVQRACDRIDECRAKMGLVFGQGVAKPGSWAWDRQIAQMQYDGVFDWRKGSGGVFLENNWSMNVPKRFIRLMVAKVASDLLGTEPYFACMPEKAEDAELAKQVEKLVQDAVADSNMSEVLREAVRVAMTCGERAVKLTHVYDATEFRGPAVVAVDREGKPVTTPGGDYIFPKDDFVHEPGRNGQVRLRKEPAFALEAGSELLDARTGKLRYAQVDDLPQKLVHKDGLEAGGISCEDFIFPIDVPSLDKADIIVHVYDDTLETLQQVWGDKTHNERFQFSATGALSQASQPVTQQARNHNRELVNVHEVYIRCDADEDGKDEWIFLVLDFRSRESIYEEYLGNLGMKPPPFKLIRGVESVPGRAYGNGVYKMFEHKSLFIDVQFNRVALKSSKEGSITFVHKDGTEECKSGIELVIGDRKSYVIPANSVYGKDRPPVFRINLNEVDEYAMNLLQTMIQTGMLEFGIVSAADGAETDLNASGTATGVRNIERTGNLLHRMTEELMAKDIEGALRIATDIVLENMDPEAGVFSKRNKELVKLNRDEIRLLPRDVRLLLTKIRSEEGMAASAQVVQLLDAYYGRPMWMRKKVRPEYIAQLKMLDVQDADERLDEPTDEEIAQEQASPGSSTAQGAHGQGPSESITARLTDFQPGERSQVLQKYFGIQAGDASGLTSPGENVTNADHNVSNLDADRAVPARSQKPVGAVALNRPRQH